MRVPIGDEIPNSSKPACERILRNHFPIYSNPFAKRDEVRGYEQARAIAMCAADGIDHGANRAFAVRAGDVDDFGISIRRGAERTTRGAYAPQTEFVKQAADVLQAELYAEALEAVQPGKRLFVC